MVHRFASHSLPAKYDAGFFLLDAIPVQPRVVEVVAPRTDTSDGTGLAPTGWSGPEILHRGINRRFM